MSVKIVENVLTVLFKSERRMIIVNQMWLRLTTKLQRLTGTLSENQSWYCWLLRATTVETP